MRVIVSGGAGSGKSTVAKAVAKRFGLRHVSTGDKNRLIARRLGFKTSGASYLKFHEYMKSHPVVDREIDELILKDLRRGGCVVDSHLAAHLYKGKAYRIMLKVPVDVAAERNALREGVGKSEVLMAVSKRNLANARRYKRLYGVDVNDLSVYDLVLDTSYFSIRDMNNVVLHIISKFYKKHS